MVLIRSKMVLLGGALLAGLALAEGLVRWLGLGPEVYELPVGAFRLSAQPGLDYEFKPLAPYGQGFINAAGMRDRFRTIETPPGVFRIACLGDSICAGMNVAATQTFCHAWEELAATNHPQVEVLNFGVPGYNLGRVMATLRSRVLPYRPDLVVYAYCLNDVQQLSFELEALKERQPPAQLGYWIRAQRPYTSWLNHSRLYVLARYGVLQAWARTPAPPAVNPEDDPQIRALARGEGAAYFTALYTPANRERFTQAMREFAQLSSAQCFVPVMAVFPIRRAGADDPLAALHDWLAATAQAQGVRVVDLRETLADPALFTDFLHPTPVGHRRTAQALAQALGDVMAQEGLPPAAGVGAGLGL